MSSQHYRASIGSQPIDLPIVEIDSSLAIALLISVDQGVSFVEKAGVELADRLQDLGIEIVVSVATMGIPLAIETTRALGLDDYVILHKTRKIHLADGFMEPVRSITTDAHQELLFDRARTSVVEGRRVAIIDDVISTGSSIAAALRLVRRVGGEPVALGCLMTEGSRWGATLGADASLVVALGAVPVFSPDGRGAFQERWDH